MFYSILAVFWVVVNDLIKVYKITQICRLKMRFNNF